MPQKKADNKEEFINFTHSQTIKPCFLRVSNTSLLKTLGKGEIVRNEQFLLLHDFQYTVLSSTNATKKNR